MAFFSELCPVKPARSQADAVGDAFDAYCIGIRREAVATVSRFAAPLSERSYSQPDARNTYAAVRAACDEIRAAALAACS